MSNVFKLPNGGALYTHDELNFVASVIIQARKDYLNTEKISSEHADAEWLKLGLGSRIWLRLMSGIYKPDLWFVFYNEKYHDLMKKYKGSFYIGTFGERFNSATYNAATEVINMSKSGKNCYLNPTQISVVELVNSHGEV